MPSLTGAFLDIVVVEDYDTEDETETIIGQTTEDIEVERDSEDAEWQEHNDPTMNRMELATELDLTFEMIVTGDRQNLRDAGMLNDEGRVQRNTLQEAVRVVIFEDPEDDEPNTVFEATDAQFKFESMELPIDDIGTIEVMCWVNGDIAFLNPEDVYGTDDTTE